MNELFLSILNTSISAGYFVITALLLRLLLKKAPRWILVLLWGLVAIRLLCPFTIESSLSLVPSAETISPEILYGQVPSIQSGIPIVNTVVNPIISQPSQSGTSQSVYPAKNGIQVAALVWLAGLALMTLYTFCSYCRLRRKIGTAVCQQENIYFSEHVASPFILGLIRPRIYLPLGIASEDMSHIVAHEQAHIRRKDHWWKPLGFLLLSIHWFNPLLWVAYILLCRDIEVACDEKVVKSLTFAQRADYSETLLKFSIKRSAIIACPLAFGEVSVKERVRNVINYKKPAFWIILVSIIICIAVAFCFLTDPVTDDPQTDYLETPQQTPGPVEAWFDIANIADRETGEFQLDAFPGVTFRWDEDHVEADNGETITTLMSYTGLYRISACDLSMDGYPELCASIYNGENVLYVIAHDYKAEMTYTLRNSSAKYSYMLYRKSDYLMCAKISEKTGKTEESGRLILAETDTTSELKIIAPPPPAEYTGTPIQWFDRYQADSPSRAQVKLDAFPDTTFSWDFRPYMLHGSDALVAIRDGVETELFPKHGMITSVFVADITGDGKPDICANAYFMFSGLASFNAVYVYDYANDRYLCVIDDVNTNHSTKVSYYIRLEEGELVCYKIHEATGQTLAIGTLTVADQENGTGLQMQIQQTYDPPVNYYYEKDYRDRESARLTVCGDGTCTLWVVHPNVNVESYYANGTYEKQDDTLVMTAEDGNTYLFRYWRDALIFLTSESSPLPESFDMFSNVIMEKHEYFPSDQPTTESTTP